ncbi:MAG: 5-(carboxyamino)imidazole ribonucleotide mutase [Clostridia bacterium]|nr:5-(carboxyamino)imidazole ribonucleotide mutase [Clostridia bacterium]
MKKIAIIMGSDSDMAIVAGAAAKLDEFSIPYEMRIMSAHRTPAAVARFAQDAFDNGYGVIIAAAGKAAHLAGVIASHTVLPVIAIPISSPALGGLDALLASVQMPSGIPVATVAIDGAANAAILAAEILALSDESLRAKLLAMRLDMERAVLAKDGALRRDD